MKEVLEASSGNLYISYYTEIHIASKWKWNLPI